MKPEKASVDVKETLILGGYLPFFEVSVKLGRELHNKVMNASDYITLTREGRKMAERFVKSVKLSLLKVLKGVE